VKLNFHHIRTLLGAELKLVFRDRRVLIASILLPVLLSPLLILGSQYSVKKREQALSTMNCFYTVAGERTNELRSVLARVLAAAGTNQGRLQETNAGDAMKALDAGAVHLVIATSDAVLAGWTNSASATNRTSGAAFHFRVAFRGDREESTAALDRLQSAVRGYRSQERERQLSERGWTLKVADLAPIEARDLARADQVAGLRFGRFLTLLLAVLLFSGAAVVATDSLAGERERGTLETLLASAVGRVEILMAKQLSILCVAVLVTLIQALNLLVYLHFKILPGSGDLAGVVTPGVILLLFILYLPFAALISSALLLISGRCRTYKEAQMMFLPAMLVGLLPALAPMLPGISLRSVFVLVPMANLAIGVRDVLGGARDWWFLAVAWLVTAGTAAWVVRQGVCLLASDRFVAGPLNIGSGSKSGRDLLERQVWAWFAALWGLLIIVSGYAQNLDVRAQILINMLGIFLAGSVAMIWRYRLNVVETLSLRRPHPAVWVGLAAAFPGGLITGVAIQQVANRLLPAPTSYMEAFGEALFGHPIPLWQMVVFVAVFPAVFEEIAFRGVLLHALRRRFHPVMVCVLVGLVFGVFHVALFRLAPTAWLGVLFGAATLLSGSIYPAIIWHFLNNTMGLVAQDQGFTESALGMDVYLPGAAMLGVGFWVFWRCRVRP
jgi:ABC-type Na+ efflux pump permease subunit/membrane protease YdiL (CAAX protease family)